MSLSGNLKEILLINCIAFFLLFSLSKAEANPSYLVNSYHDAQMNSSLTKSEQNMIDVHIGNLNGRMIRPLLGVNAGPSPAGNDPRNPDLTGAYKKIGVNLIRTHDFYGPLDMAVMYPDRMKNTGDVLSYNFYESDLKWKSICEGGFEPYFRLGDSWNNARPPKNKEEFKNWVNAAIEVIRHYHKGKWNGFNTNFRYVEIWNEPDNQQFWQKPHTPMEYYRLYDETAKAIKQNFPELKVGGPGITQVGFEIPRGKKWLHEFLRYIKQHNSPLDFFSWHIYSNDPQDWLRASEIYRRELDQLGFENVPFHVTEYNTSTMFMDNNPEEKLALRTGAKGASILTAAWIAMQKVGVEEATFYRGNDPSMDDVAFYGLFYANGKPKRIALAFSLWSSMAKHPQMRDVSDNPKGTLWVLAGQDNAGKVAILLANPSDTSVRYSISGVNVNKYLLRQVNQASNNILSEIINDNELMIGEYSVQLLTSP